MTYKTKGVVLRTVKYGETSIVATIFTELFGLQTYMVNGVRTTKKSSAKANLFQPAAILDMVVYHHEQKNMHRIKEFKWDFLYDNVLTNVIKNSVALYMVELLFKCLKQPEQHTDLFYFFEDALKALDEASPAVTGNFPLYFSLQLSHFFGFKLTNDFTNTDEQFYIDLQEGVFTPEQPPHHYFIEGEPAIITADLLKVLHPDDLGHFKLHHEVRRKLLLYYQTYYALHIQDFGQMKTLMVLQDVL
ncbi:MAG: DNA repair protein RecO [Chitinophagaceae bacterium]|nr:DNA repair protein RecO [Chitinophagaceae bacterium]